MKKKIIFLDVQSIQKRSLKSFLNSKAWPVSETIFWKLANFIFEEYIKELKKLDQRSYKIALIELRFISLLINILHYNYVKNYSKENNYKCIYDKSSEQFFNPDWEQISKAYQNYEYPYNKLQRIFRKLVKLIYFNSHLSFKDIIKGVFSKKENLSFGSFDKIKQDFIKKNNKFFLHVEWIDFLNKVDFKNKKLTPNKKLEIRIINNILAKVSRSSTLRLFVKGLDLKKINLASQKRLESISIIYEHLLYLKAPKQVIFTESPNPFHKILSSVYISKGSKVINFSHGNDFGLVSQKWTQTYFYAQTSNYVLENSNICNIIKKSSYKLPLVKMEKTSFLSANSNIGLKRNSITYSKIINKKIKKVMLIGFPMNSLRYTDDAYCFFHYKLKLEVHILKNLKYLGYYTIYKTHPDRVREIGSIMNNLVDECNSNTFESVWQETDALIFTYCTTTTFGYAITTPLPIVLVNIKSTKWNLQRKKQIRKRVEFLDFSYNKGNKDINSYKLKNCINKAREKMPIEKIRGF